MNDENMEYVLQRLEQAHQAIAAAMHSMHAPSAQAPRVRPERGVRWYTHPLIDAARTWLRRNPYTTRFRPHTVNVAIARAIGHPGEIPTCYLKQALIQEGYTRQRTADGTWYYPPRT